MYFISKASFLLDNTHAQRQQQVLLEGGPRRWEGLTTQLRASGRVWESAQWRKSAEVENDTEGRSCEAFELY